jgi:hypothetical protein
MTNLRSSALPASLLIPLVLGAPKPAPIPGDGGLFIALPATQVPAKEPPREWIDPDTRHRVVRLSDEPASQSLSFHSKVDTTLNVYTQVLDGAAHASADRAGSELFRIVQKSESEAPLTH